MSSCFCEHVHVYTLYTMCVGACKAQRRESDSLDLEIQATLRGKVWGRSLNLVLWKNSRGSFLLSQLSSPLGHLLTLQTIKRIFRTPTQSFLNFKEDCVWISEGGCSKLKLTQFKMFYIIFYLFYSKSPLNSWAFFGLFSKVRRSLSSF